MRLFQLFVLFSLFAVIAASAGYVATTAVAATVAGQAGSMVKGQQGSNTAVADIEQALNQAGSTDDETTVSTRGSGNSVRASDIVGMIVEAKQSSRIRKSSSSSEGEEGSSSSSDTEEGGTSSEVAGAAQGQLVRARVAERIQSARQLMLSVSESAGEGGSAAVEGKKYACYDGSLEENVACRVNERVRLSTQTGQASPTSYVPQRCLVKDDDEGMAYCMEFSERVVECAQMGDVDEKVSCIQETVGMKKQVMEQVRECRKGDNGTNETCMGTLRERVRQSAIAKLQVLGDKVEKLVDSGAGHETVGAFLVKLEQYQVELESAVTKEEKTEILQSALEDWKEFKGEVMQDIRLSYAVGNGEPAIEGTVGGESPLVEVPDTAPQAPENEEGMSP